MSLIHRSIDIDLLRWQSSLDIVQKAGKTYVKDPIRKKNIILQPEEWVRQLLIQYFVNEAQFHRNQIQVEKTIIVNDLSRRFDIVIYDKDISPFVLVECKAPDVKITQSTFDQIAVYNMKLNAPYLIVTNGKTTYCAAINHDLKGYDFMDKIPIGFLRG